MIKSYWKQLLIALYIVAVLVLSATARANHQTNHDDLDNLEIRLLAAVDHKIEPAVFAEPQPSSTLHAFEDVGFFRYDDSANNIVFISSTTDRIYSVVCDDNIKSQLSAEDFFVVSGFDLSTENQDSNRPPKVEDRSEHMNASTNSTYALYVTGVQIQR